GDAEARWESVGEIVNTLADYQSRAESPSLRDYLDETSLSGRDDLKSDDKKPAAITLMTLHSAKGLEFPYVYLVGMEEGLLPHRRAVEDAGGAGIDEERRLCYVGVTRAKDHLTFSYARARMKWGKERPGIPSRFLMEMRGETEKAARAAEAARNLFASERFGRETKDGTQVADKGAKAGAKRTKAGSTKTGKASAKPTAASALAVAKALVAAAAPPSIAAPGLPITRAATGKNGRAPDVAARRAGSASPAPVAKPSGTPVHRGRASGPPAEAAPKRAKVPPVKQTPQQRSPTPGAQRPRPSRADPPPAAVTAMAEAARLRRDSQYRS
ncbi:MAG TPA: 3'-5' exonuclease, partial [Polyangiaceae bacterium]